MSQPIPVLPGKTYLMSRRCTRREFRMVPSPAVIAIVGYCIAEAAAMYGILIHGVMFMTNHYHAVVTDVNGVYPEFIRRVHRHIATCMNAKFGWTENFWSSDRTNVVALEDASAVQRKLIYTLANPVTAGLVEKAAEWPGFHTAGIPFGACRTFKRPNCYFREDGPMPETATLQLVKPPALADLSDEECTAVVEEALREAEEEIQRSRRAAGKTFLGTKRCLELHRMDRPSSSDEDDHAISPTFATLDPELYKAALKQRRAFLAEYRDAYRRWKAGERDVEFPPGTYWLRVHAGVRCRAPT